MRINQRLSLTVVATCLTALSAACGQPEQAPSTDSDSSLESAPVEDTNTAPESELMNEPDNQDTQHPLADTRWVATAIRGEVTDPDVSSTLEFEGTEKVSGTGGCNRYFGPASIDGDKLQFRNLGTTMMGCPEPISAQETRFLKAMADVGGWSVDSGELELMNDEGESVLSFARQAAEPEPGDS